MPESSYVIRLGRGITSALLLIGCGFLLVGLDALWLHAVLPTLEPTAGNATGLAVLMGFFVLVGATIALQMLAYLVRPPALLTADGAGISFATGFRYTPYRIPWSNVGAIGLGSDATMAVSGRAIAGLQIEILPGDGIPAALATSIGVSYVFHTLTLSAAHMDQLPTTACDQLRAFQTHRRSPDA